MSVFPIPTALIDGWYSWGVAIAFAVTFVTTLWIFFDSQSNGYQASLWRWLSLLAAIIVIPSVILSFSPALKAGLSEAFVDALALAGMVATIVSLFSLLLYGLGVGVTVIETASSPVAGSTPPFSDANGMAPANTRTRPATHPTPTPPRGVQPTTKEKPVTPQRITPTGSETIRIKNAYETDLPLAWVVALNGPQAGQEYRLQKITDIGRESDHNDVVLNDPTISRQHARIRYEKGAFVIYDLASANGVFINGEQVQRRVIAHGDRIKLGQMMLGVLMVREDFDTETAPDAINPPLTTQME